MKKITLLIGALCCMMILYFVYTLYPKHDDKGQDMATTSIWRTASALETLSYKQTYNKEELHNQLIQVGYTSNNVKEILDALPTSTNEDTRYCFLKMDEFSYPEGYKLQARFIVQLDYHLKQLETIASITPVGIYTGDGRKSIYTGIISSSLSSNYFFYNFYGNLYADGNINVSYSKNENDSKTLRINTSNLDQSYKNISESGSYHFSISQP